MSRIEEELRELLAARAAALPAENDPYQRTARSIRRARWRRSLAVVLCVGVLAAAAAPIAVFRPFTRSSPMAWPVRGALAGDGEFRAGARQEASDWLQLRQPDLRIRSSRVVYAGQGAQRRRAVVALSVQTRGSSEAAGRGDGARPGASRTYVRLALLSGPPNAAGDRLEHQTSALYRPQRSAPARPALPPTSEAVRAPAPAMAWVEKRANGRAELFVLGPPDTQSMAYSPRVTFRRDGTWQRSWYRLPAGEGRAGVVHRTVADPHPATDLLRLGLRRGKVTVPAGGGDPASGGEAQPENGVPRDVSRVVADTSRAGAAFRGRSDGLRSALVALRRQTGIPLKDFDIRARWHRSRQSGASGHSRQSQQSWLLAATLPSGVTFQVVSLRGGSLGNHVVLVPRGAGGRPVAVAEPEHRPSGSGPDPDDGASTQSGQGPAGDPGGDRDSAENPGQGEDAVAGTGQDSGDGSEQDGEDTGKGTDGEGAGPYSEQDSEDSGDSEEREKPCPDFGQDAEKWDDYRDGGLRGNAGDPVRRVTAVAPGYADGYVQLWLRGEELATMPVDTTERAVFDGHLVECVVEDDGDGDRYGVGDLQVRVVSGSGQQVYRGPVHAAEDRPPWNRPAGPRG